MSLIVKNSTIQGKGTFTNTKIKKGQLITNITGKKYSESDIDDLIDLKMIGKDDDFQITEDHFLKLDKTFYYVNHNCNPNGGVIGSNKLIAIRDIEAGEEITYDYSTVTGKTSYENTVRYSNLNWSMICNCGVVNCRKEISSIFTVPKPILKKYNRLGILPKFLINQLNGQLK